MIRYIVRGGEDPNIVVRIVGKAGVNADDRLPVTRPVDPIDFPVGKMPQERHFF